MSFVQIFLKKLFCRQPLTPEQVEEKQEQLMNNLLWAMVQASPRMNNMFSELQIYQELKKRGIQLKAEEFLTLVNEGVRKGFMQRIGKTPPFYIVSPNGCNYIGLPGNTIHLE